MKCEHPFTVSFWIHKGSDCSVEVKAWARDGLDGEKLWHWNVYGHVFENHRMFATPEILQNMPLHWGASFDEFRTSRPAFGIKYDWQKENRAYTFGSDYSHYNDPESWPAPLDGIPWQVEKDAQELAEWLKEDV